MYKSPANSKQLKPIRRVLRTHSTQAECVLWRLLKGSQVGGLKFRRQHSIGPYVMDFFCPMLKLGIELDGGIHEDMLVHVKDDEKEAFLIDNGITIMRFPNEVVFNNFECIKKRILEYKEEYLKRLSPCFSPPPLTPPPRRRGQQGVK